MKSAVVIGAGHNGLVAANYLIDAGYRVTVLEATSRVGGMAATAALIAVAPNHLLSPCAIDAVYWNASTVSTDLNLPAHGLRTIRHDPAWGWVSPDGDSLVLQSDLQKTIEEIRRFSRRDAVTYESMACASIGLLAVQDLYGMADPLHPGWRTVAAAARRIKNKEVRSLLGRLFAGTAAEVIDDMFEAEAVRGIFASMASILGSITQDSSGVGLMATAPLHQYGVARAVGGMQAIPDSLASRLATMGGNLRTSTPAVRIVVEAGRCVGVELAGGEIIDADRVISAAPPHVTARLLGSERIPGLPTLRRAPANAANIGCYTLNFALSGTLQLSRLRRRDGLDMRRPSLFHGTLEMVIKAESECRRGLVPTDPPWTATILSATDPTQAPAGEDVFYLYGPAPVEPADGWDIAGAKIEKRLIAAAAPVYDGLEQLEIGRFAESPRDLEARLGAENGCIYHVDQIATRLGPARPGVGWGGHRTPVPGLYLSGAGTHPGGGVSGIPGQLAARAVLADD